MKAFQRLLRAVATESRSGELRADQVEVVIRGSRYDGHLAFQRHLAFSVDREVFEQLADGDISAALGRAFQMAASLVEQGHGDSFRFVRIGSNEGKLSSTTQLQRALDEFIGGKS